MPPKSLLTPRELADAIGASESSLRRWVDGGTIRVSRTAGGHRRIPIEEAVRFIRQTGATVVRPDLLGLPVAGPPIGASSADTLDDALYGALARGDAATARALLTSLYLAGTGLAAIFDGPLRAAMHRLGELWQHDRRGILIEHRATEMVIEAVVELRRLLPAPPPAAPLAIGAAPQGDLYLLPSLMAAVVLADVGFRDVNFGPDTPLELLAREAIEGEARLVWVSVTGTQDFGPLRTSVRRFAATLAEHRIKLVLGGRHAAAVSPRAASNVVRAQSMSELADFARKLLASSARKA